MQQALNKVRLGLKDGCVWVLSADLCVGHCTRVISIATPSLEAGTVIVSFSS